MRFTASIQRSKAAIESMTNLRGMAFRDSSTLRGSYWTRAPPTGPVGVPRVRSRPRQTRRSVSTNRRASRRLPAS
jgi:hypothetical protein